MERLIFELSFIELILRNYHQSKSTRLAVEGDLGDWILLKPCKPLLFVSYIIIEIFSLTPNFLKFACPNTVLDAMQNAEKSKCTPIHLHAQT
jgi:hypothetical protein